MLCSIRLARPVLRKGAGLLVFGLIFLNASCVGTVEEASLSKNLSRETTENTLIFSGVQEVRAIAHDKIEVYFFPAMGGSEKYTYKIYYGGNPLPAVTASDVLNTDYRGLLRFTLTGLEPSRNYIIRVDVEDQVTREYHLSSIVLEDKTFSTRVADFYGISHVSNLAGIDGIDSLKVRWTHAECIDAVRCDQDSDPSRYEIILLDRTNMGRTPADFDNRDLTPDDGRYVKVINYSSSNNLNEAIVRGLRGGTEYYVLVRAIHRGSVDDINRPQLRSELNKSYLSIKTLSDDLASLEFDTGSLVISNLPGADAVSGLRAKWSSAVGVFDHYRLYFADEDASLNLGAIPDDCQSTLGSSDNPSTTILCKKTPYSQTEVILGGLSPYTHYDFILVLCQTVECADGERIIAQPQFGITETEDPNLAGIDKIIPARNISEFGSLTLDFEPVDLNQTFIEGYVVEYKSNPSSDSSAEYLVLEQSDPSYADGNLYLEPYDVRSASSLVVRGVEYYTNETYCFRVYPFNYDSDGNRVTYENQKWECINNPEYKVPTQIEFRGLRASRTEGTQVTLRWQAPAVGVFEEYELYYIDKSTNKSLFGTAPQELDDWNVTSDYGRIIVSPNQTEITLSGFPENSIFEFGILTNFNGTYGKLRSEENSNFVICNFKDLQNLDCVGGY